MSSLVGGGLWGGGGTDTSSSANNGSWTIASILYHALRKARVTHGPGRTPSVDQIGDAFFLLRALLDLWNVQRLTIVNVSRTVYDLVAGTADYTLGPTGDWVTTAGRPPLIEWAGRIIDEVETPIEVFTLQRWAEVALKDLESIPMGIRYQPTMPNGTVTAYPVPSEVDSIALYTWDTVSDPAAADDSITLSPGFVKALIENLALDCCDTFGTPMSPRLVNEARKSKAAIERLNAPASPRLRSDVPGSGGGYGVRTWGPSQ